MPNSDSTATRQSIIERALRRINIDSPSTDESALGAEVLNDVVAELDPEGRWLWAISNTEETLYTIAGQRSYPVRTFGYASLTSASQISILSSVLSTSYSNDWTISFWCRLRSIDFVQVDNLSAGRGLQIVMSGDGNSFITLAHDGTNYIQLSTDFDFSDFEWHHVAVSNSGTGLASALTLYIDGAAVTTTTVIDNLAGQSSTSSNPWLLTGNDTGRLCQLGIYSEVITANEVADIYAQRLNVETDLTTLSTGEGDREVLTHYYPLASDSVDVIAAVNGTDTSVTYVTDTTSGHGIAPFIQSLETMFWVNGTTRNPIEIIDKTRSLTTYELETTGQPYLAYLEIAANPEDQKLHFLPTPSAIYQMNYAYQRMLYDFDSASDEPDVRRSMRLSLIKVLANELASEMGVPQALRQDVMLEAQSARLKLRADNSERAKKTPVIGTYF